MILIILFGKGSVFDLNKKFLMNQLKNTQNHTKNFSSIDRMGKDVSILFSILVNNAKEMIMLRMLFTLYLHQNILMNSIKLKILL